jgi:hypothetical protein
MSSLFDVTCPPGASPAPFTVPVEWGSSTFDVVIVLECAGIDVFRRRHDVRTGTDALEHSKALEHEYKKSLYVAVASASSDSEALKRLAKLVARDKTETPTSNLRDLARLMGIEPYVLDAATDRNVLEMIYECMFTNNVSACSNNTASVPIGDYTRARLYEWLPTIVVGNVVIAAYLAYLLVRCLCPRRKRRSKKRSKE